MRNSNLLKWAQNMNNKSGKDAENRNWIHPPEALSRGHIAYLVKFLGNLEVDQPKGIEVVKEGIRKLKFNQQHIRKSEGSKLPKVELTISVDGVAIQEPKTKRIMHQYPLHRISYCADDKAERRFFSFIVKETPESEQHMCFVFLSDKLAEDITLTIGQAFDLAYKLSQNDAIWTTSWCGGSKANKRTFRSCHLDVNKPLPLYYADELPDLQDYSAGRAVPQMPSGMEKDEEAEHHLQRAMVTGHVIPTPEVYTIDPTLYDMLYPACFTLPRRLIHMQPFALEQDIPEYDIDSEDEEWLRSQAKSIDLPNAKFEEMVDRLERNSDHTVVSEQDAKSLLRDYDESLIIAVYDYWLNKRFKTKHNLLPQVKTEVRGNTAVNDPYVAFRRRKDKMQTRKNRKNDESSYEKMIKLSWDLTSAQDIVEMIKKRELLKKDLVQVSIDIFKKRYELQDWTGQQYQEAILVSKALRHNTPLSSHNKYNNSWSSTHHPVHKKYNSYVDDEIIPKKEKRHYKKRKLKSVPPASSAADVNASCQFRLSSDDEQGSPQLSSSTQHTQVEDNYFTFRRAGGVSYHAPKSTLGDWPWAGGTDVRHRFNPVYIRTPVARCIGLARRRIGRGGRVILDRLGPSMDDLWRDLDVQVLERERYFRPKTPPNSFSDESEVETDAKVETFKPYLEIEEVHSGGKVPPSPASTVRSTHIEINFHKPFQIEEDTTTNILERISEDTGHGSILDPFYKTLIKKKLDLMKAGSSLIERWNKLSTHVDMKDEVPYLYEDTLGSSKLSLTNSRKSFLDTAASERIANKRKYDQLASSCVDRDDEPTCPKCKCVRFVHEDLTRNESERNTALRDELHNKDVNEIARKLVYYLCERIEINEQIRAELVSQLKVIQEAQAADTFNSIKREPPDPSAPCTCSHSMSSCLRHSTPDAPHPSPRPRLRDRLNNVSHSICICDNFPSSSSLPLSSQLLSSGQCMLTHRAPEDDPGDRTQTLGSQDEYLLPGSGLVVRRADRHSATLADTDRRFLEMEVQRRLMVLQQRVNSLESENAVLKKRLTDLATSDVDVATYMRVHGLTDLTLVETTTNGNTGTSNSAGGNTGDSKPTAQTNGMTSLLLNLNDTPTTPAVTNGSSVPPVPPRSFHNDLLSELALTSSPGGAGSSAVAPSVGRKLEGLLLDDLLEDDFDPRAHESASGSANSATGSASSASVAPPLLAPPPQTRRGNNAASTEDVFGLTPFNNRSSDQGSVSRDPFGMEDFGMGSVVSNNSADHEQNLQSALGLLDRRILEMKDGFSRGLSIGTEDFSIESLDPLRQ
ncbi:hypothetical protein M8J75_003486 [Diaphorina citri]|nr:hypothetical protein M8J75_003486 [Diaphorina citri]